MATVLELAAEIVSSHASTTEMSTDELLHELRTVYNSLQSLESGKQPVGETGKSQTVSVRQAFKANEVICLLCGKGGMKTLTRHIRQMHNLKPSAYRKMFGIKSTQSLAARNFSEARRQMAHERGLADNLAKAREVRAAKLLAKREPARTRSAH